MAAEAREVSAALAEPLWRPTAARIAAAPITRYRAWLQALHGLEFPDYESLWRWSVTELEAFWQSIVEFSGIRFHVRTLTGKKLEVPVKRILLGHPVAKAVNVDSMANPAIIDWFVAFQAART